MSRGLVGHNVGDYATSQKFRVHLGSVSNQTHAARNSIQLRLMDNVQRLIQVAGHSLQISMTDCLLDSPLVDLYCLSDPIIHGHVQGLCTDHLVQPCCPYCTALELTFK